MLILPPVPQLAGPPPLMPGPVIVLQPVPPVCMPLITTVGGDPGSPVMTRGCPDGVGRRPDSGEACW